MTRTALALFLLALSPAFAPAGLIIQTPGPLAFTDPGGVPSTAPSFGRLARVDVGPDPVVINQIGINGSVSQAANLKFLVFQGTTNGVSPVFQTAPIALSVGPAGWIDSPVFAPFTLLANTTYWIGPAVDGANPAFFTTGNFPSTVFTQNGLTLPAGENGNVRTSFANPTLDAPTGVLQVAVRLFGPDDVTPVPEPGTLAVFGLLAVGGWAARRRK